MKVPQTLADMLDNNAWKYPDETAFVWNDRRVTHAQFHDRVSRLASALRRLGLKRQDRVGILSQNSLEFQEVYGACEISGFICATVNWRLAIPEMVYIINDGSPKVMIFEAAYAETVAAMKDQLKTVEHYICVDGRWISHPITKISSARAILLACRFDRRPMMWHFSSTRAGLPAGPRVSCCPRAGRSRRLKS